MIHRRDALKAFTALSGALLSGSATAAPAAKVSVTLVRWPYT